MGYLLTPAFLFNKTAVSRVIKLSITCFHAGMAIDADGSPRAYHPDNTGLDDLKHGGYAGNWWGIATSNETTNGEPLIQTARDPAPGFYVSTTSLIDHRFTYDNPMRYVNAEKIPYFVLPEYFSPDIQLGDIAWIYNTLNNKSSFAIFADVGPDVGEGSMRLAEKIGIDNHPRYGGMASGILYFIFEGSGHGNGRHLSESQITERGEEKSKNIQQTGLIELFQR